MIHNITHIHSFDNTRLFMQSWQPKNEAKAVICLVHGIGEHSSRYYEWAERFVDVGFALLSFDQRGHGLSDGKRGVISSYEDFMNDIDVVLEEANKLFPDLPFFLYGHSMGGGEVLNHLLKRKANYLGVISTSPWIVSQASPPKFVLPFLRMMNKIIPSYSISTSFDATLLSHDKEEVKKYNEDELIHHMVSFRLFVDAYDAGYFVLDNNNNDLQKPLLLLHGTDDEITSCQASQAFSESYTNKCTFIKYDKAFHELHHDFCKNLVFSDILLWLESQLIENK